MNNIWFTSDQHYGHDKIIEYCDRPFKNVDEMNEELIKRYNDLVKPDDLVYHLGDFAFDNNPGKFFHRLNGDKILILGNHDRQPVKQLPWKSVHDYYELKIGKTFIVLCHYCFKVFNKSHRGALQFFGHSHGSMSDNRQQLDIGVDNNNFYPINLDQIETKLKKLPAFQSADGHK
jgi:calcineurin-like phosphoesterase family protein